MPDFMNALRGGFGSVMQGAGNVLGGIGQGLGQIDPMTAGILGSNMLAANQPTPGHIGGMTRLGMGMQNALPQLQQMRSQKQERESREELRKVAREGLKTIDLDGDGVVSSPLEVAIQQVLKAGAVSQDPGPYLMRAEAMRAQAMPQAPKAPETRKMSLPDGKVQDQEMLGNGVWRDVGSPYDRRAGPLSTTNVYTGDNQKPTSSTLGDIQSDIVGAEQTLAELKGVADTYSDEYLTGFGRFKAQLGAAADKWLNADPAGLATFNADRTKFANSVRQFFNSYRKEITGAAASVQELELLMQAMFNEDTGPRQFQAAFEQFMGKAEAQLAINRRIAREGINVGGEATGAGGVPNYIFGGERPDGY